MNTDPIDPDTLHIIHSWRTCRARNDDPETAHEAARKEPTRRSEQREKVYRVLKGVGAKGATDYEVGTDLHILRTSAGKRRKELQEAGLVLDSGRRGETDTGSTAIIWVLKEYAEEAQELCPFAEGVK